MTKTNKQAWFKNFKKSLTAGTKYTKEMPLICFTDTHNTDRPIYKDDITGNVTVDTLKNLTDPVRLKCAQELINQEMRLGGDKDFILHYHLIDVAKHSRRLKNKCIENAIFHVCNKNQYRGITSLVTDNQFLTLIAADYHVALLDASADFTENYYPNCHLGNYDIISQIPWAEKINYFQYVLQCIVFINDDGSYFLALPISAPYLAHRPKKEQRRDRAHLPIIKTTIKAMQEIIKPLPLFRYNNIPIVQLNPIWTQGDNLIYLCNYDQFMPTVYRQLFKQQDLVKNKGINNATNDIIDGFLVYNCYENEKIMFDYLNEQVNVSLLANGHYLMKTDSKVPYWQSKFNHDFARLSDLLSFRDPRPTILHVADLISIYDKVWITNRIYQYHTVQCPQIDLTLTTPQQTKAEEITLPKSTSLTPLVNKQKLSQVTLSLKSSTYHQYYGLKNQLITLEGENQVESETKLIL